MPFPLPDGSYIRFRYKGEWDYGMIVNNQLHYQLMSDEQVPVGSTVHQGVWKGDNRTRFEVRRTYVKRGAE